MGSKIPPAAVRVANLIRRKVRLVLHRRAAFDIIAQIDIGDLKFRGTIDDIEDIPGPQGTIALVGIVEEVNGRQSAGKKIDVADADQSVAQIIAPLLSKKRILDKRIGITV